MCLICFIEINFKTTTTTCLKSSYGLSGNDYRVVTVSKLYLTCIEIIMKVLNQEDNSNMSKLTKKAIRYGRTGPNYRKASLLEIQKNLLFQMCLLLTAICCWMFWFLCYLAQMNPLIGTNIIAYFELYG